MNKRTILLCLLFVLALMALAGHSRGASGVAGGQSPREPLERRVMALEEQMDNLRATVKSQQEVIEVLKQDYRERHGGGR